MIKELADAAGVANYVFGFAMGMAIALAVLKMLRNRQRLGEDTTAFLSGVGWFGFGVFLHQFWWFVWAAALENYADNAAWMVEQRWIVTGAYMVMGFGGLKCWAVASGLHAQIGVRMYLFALGVWLFGLCVGYLI